MLLDEAMVPTELLQFPMLEESFRNPILLVAGSNVASSGALRLWQIRVHTPCLPCLLKSALELPFQPIKSESVTLAKQSLDILWDVSDDGVGQATRRYIDTQNGRCYWPS